MKKCCTHALNTHNRQAPTLAQHTSHADAYDLSYKQFESICCETTVKSIGASCPCSEYVRPVLCINCICCTHIIYICIVYGLIKHNIFLSANTRYVSIQSKWFEDFYVFRRNCHTHTHTHYIQSPLCKARIAMTIEKYSPFQSHRTQTIYGMNKTDII